MSSLEAVKSKIAQASTEIVGLAIEADWVEIANPKAGSHLALPCFRFAKEAGKSPAELASQIAESIEVAEIVKAEPAGPYVNLWVSSGYLADLAAEQAAKHLNDADSNGKKAIVEFLSPNLAKPLSIGHFRNVLQGRFLTRILKNEGYEVITDNHIGDWGTVFGMWVVGFEKFSSDEQLASGGVKELGRMYVEVRKALKQDDDSANELEQKIQQWLTKLEDGDEEAWSYHKKFSEISLEAVHQQMQEFGIKFDHNYGESFYVKRGKEMVNELVESGKATKNEDGSVVIELDEQGIDTPMLIQKANGAALYATSDIATIEFREKEWNPDLVLYVVGAEQQFHFQQLFAANKKCGWSDAELIHHWYGLIEEVDEDGNRRKMSSRSNAIFMSDLVDLAVKRARELAPEEVGDDDVQKIAHGALSFHEASASHTMNTVFDWDSMFSLSGFSGPYVQYAAVRISSILDKANNPAEKPADYQWQNEANLLWRMALYGEALVGTTTSWEGVKLAEYAYALAREWNRYYENNQVLDSGENEQARLWLAQQVYKHLERSLHLIGVEIPSKM